MKADIESIRKKFGVGQNKDIADEEPVEATDYGYTSHTFTVSTDKRDVGTITISDIDDDVRNVIGAFLYNIVSDGHADRSDVITITLTAAYPEIDNESDNGVIYKGRLSEYPGF